MRTVGGAIAVTAGIFGTLAAIMTLVVGLAGVFHGPGPAHISWSDWGAVVFSFATVFFAAICLHARSVSAGLILMFASLCGAVLGGVFVAGFMALTFLGGAVASAGVISEGEQQPGAATSRASSPSDPSLSAGP